MKNIVLCADLNEVSLQRLKSIHQELDLKHAKVHIVHVFEIQYYVAEFTPYVFPSEDQYKEMEKSTLAILAKLGKDLGINESNLELKCFFARSSDEKLLEYLKASNADLAVVATRGKHGVEGLFSSSLTDFLCKYSPCDILVLRPKV
jgi:nucleotide-binding universal stress UspA family protein